jgi:hypothetical protein
MKKYFFGISAIVLAIAYSSFTKPQINTERFRFTGNPNSLFEIENVSNWVRVTSADCITSVDDKVCEILVDEQYYTGTGENAELNANDPAGDDLKMYIWSSLSEQFKIGTNPDQYVNYRHVTFFTTAISIINKEVATVP